MTDSKIKQIKQIVTEVTERFIGTTATQYTIAHMQSVLHWELGPLIEDLARVTVTITVGSGEANAIFIDSSGDIIDITEKSVEDICWDNMNYSGLFKESDSAFIDMVQDIVKAKYTNETELECVMCDEVRAGLDQHLMGALKTTPTFEDLTNDVIDWAENKNLFTESDPAKQLEKTQEELTETRDAHIALRTLREAGLPEDHELIVKYKKELVDGLGDTLVTLIIFAEQADLECVTALKTAYDVIKNRTGKTIDGKFVKDES